MSIPNGKPIVYSFDEHMKPIGDPDTIGFRYGVDGDM